MEQWDWWGGGLEEVQQRVCIGRMGQNIRGRGSDLQGSSRGPQGHGGWTNAHLKRSELWPGVSPENPTGGPSVNEARIPVAPGGRGGEGTAEEREAMGGTHVPRPALVPSGQLPAAQAGRGHRFLLVWEHLPGTGSSPCQASRTISYFIMLTRGKRNITNRPQSD